MVDQKKAKGRPPSEAGNRYKFHNVRFSEEEFKMFERLAKELGLSKTELIRLRVFNNSGKVIINSRELLGTLDTIGTEMGRIGNNINQLARHANTLKLQNVLNAAIIVKFEALFEEYIRKQQQVEVSLRKIIRLMGK